MFSITPYDATRHTVVIDGQHTLEKWEPCRVIGIDAGAKDPTYIVEIRSNGEYCLDRADVIRKPAPSA